jgi:hypothetical protein
LKRSAKQQTADIVCTLIILFVFAAVMTSTM